MHECLVLGGHSPLKVQTLFFVFCNSYVQAMHLESVEENEINVFVGEELCGELSKNVDNVCIP